MRMPFKYAGFKGDKENVAYSLDLTMSDNIW